MKFTAMIIASALSASALAMNNDELNELPTAKPIAFDTVYSERQAFDSRLIQLKIFGQVTYSNDCMAKDQKFKKVAKDLSSITYDVYGAHDLDDKICPKIYSPVTKTILIDTLFVPKDHSPAIIVNQSLVH